MGLSTVNGARRWASGILGSRDSAGGFSHLGKQGEGPRLSPPALTTGRHGRRASGGIMGHARVALLEISGEVVCEMKRAYGNIWGVFGDFNAVAHPYPEKKDIGAPRPASPARHGGVCLISTRNSPADIGASDPRRCHPVHWPSLSRRKRKDFNEASQDQSVLRPSSITQHEGSILGLGRSLRG